MITTGQQDGTNTDETALTDTPEEKSYKKFKKNIEGTLN